MRILLFLFYCFSGGLISTTQKKTQCCLTFCSFVIFPPDSPGTATLDTPFQSKYPRSFKKNAYPMPKKAPSDTTISLSSLSQKPNSKISTSFSTLSFITVPTSLFYLNYLFMCIFLYFILFYVLSVNLLKFYHFICLCSP